MCNSFCGHNIKMYSKIIALLVLMAVALCQDHHHHTISLKTVVKHEQPKKVEYHHHIPVQTQEVHVPLHQGHASLLHHQSNNVGKIYHQFPKHYFVPAKEPAPVHEVIAADTPVHFVPVQHHVVLPVHHQVQQESHKETQQKESHHEHHVDYYAHPKYEYEYKVEDPHTGDKKFQHESRDGDVVKGVYSLHEPDGSIRTVKYSSDKKTGFNAEVSHKGHFKHEHHYHH
ncbi:hypothetical protein B5X24_HaOG216355 [Helicoverpa armigera]|nr:hypothetical protein B5X24_HaOG216355 [Helicoverpa armigera]